MHAQQCFPSEISRNNTYWVGGLSTSTSSVNLDPRNARAGRSLESLPPPLLVRRLCWRVHKRLACLDLLLSQRRTARSTHSLPHGDSSVTGSSCPPHSVRASVGDWVGGLQEFAVKGITGHSSGAAVSLTPSLSLDPSRPLSEGCPLLAFSASLVDACATGCVWVWCILMWLSLVRFRESAGLPHTASEGARSISPAHEGCNRVSW